MQRWLRQNVQQSYPAHQRVYVDADAALTRFATIRPKTDVYSVSPVIHYHASRSSINLHGSAYDDGRTQLLLCLHGLLPITFRASPYNIPIAIWIPRDYPREPPVAYVVPTNDMLVKASRQVDVSGRCTVDYVQQWERKSEVRLDLRFFLVIFIYNTLASISRDNLMTTSRVATCSRSSRPSKSSSRASRRCMRVHAPSLRPSRQGRGRSALPQTTALGRRPRLLAHHPTTPRARPQLIPQARARSSPRSPHRPARRCYLISARPLPRPRPFPS